MIDTVVLTIPINNCRILDPDCFNPSLTYLSTAKFGPRAFIKSLQNPPEEFIGGPYLTVTRRAVRGGLTTLLKLQFSAPKLIYKNNLDELADTDFEMVVNVLVDRMKHMGVGVTTDILNRAQVSAVHYSKNIPLPQYVTSSMIIKELSKVDLTQRLSLDRTKFKDLGYALTFCSKSYWVVVYDKIKDLQKKNGLKMDSDNPAQLNLLQKTEVLRIETRLNLKSKIVSLLRGMGEDQNTTFENLFSSRISKKIVSHFWDLMTSGTNQVVLSNDLNPEKLATEILKSEPKITTQRLLAIIGSMYFGRSCGQRPLRQFITKHYTDRTWFRLNNSLKRYKDSVGNESAYFSKVSEEITKYLPAKSDLLCKEM